MNLNILLKSMFALALLAMLPSITTAATETITWIHTDHLGSSIAGRNDAGETTWEQAYAPWGEKQAIAGVLQAPTGVGYTGHVYDEQVGLIYAGARWYDPEMGRIISPDSVRFSAARIPQFNRYAYANNNPVSYVDPDGNITQLRVPYAAGNFAGRVAVNPLINISIQAIVRGRTAHTLGTLIYDAVHSESGSEEGNTNPYAGPVDEPVIVVDEDGNAIPVGEGERITASPDGDYQQVRDRDGRETGVRLDKGGHKNQPDPKARVPHGHRPGVTDETGNPHLPVKHSGS